MTDQTDNFPTIVYKGYGPREFSRHGGTYDCKGVNNQEELDEALADKWFLSVPEAIEDYDKFLASSHVAPQERKHKEAKARELGVTVEAEMPEDELDDKIYTASVEKDRKKKRRAPAE